MTTHRAMDFREANLPAMLTPEGTILDRMVNNGYPLVNIQKAIENGH